jgi:hypothetical protein
VGDDGIGGGSVAGMIAAMDEVILKLSADVKVIPGHGSSLRLDDVRDYVKMLKETQAAVERGVQQGKTLDQLKQEKVLEPWKKWSAEFITADAFIETIYNDLSGKKDGNFIKHN